MGPGFQGQGHNGHGNGPDEKVVRVEVQLVGGDRVIGRLGDRGDGKRNENQGGQGAKSGKGNKHDKPDKGEKNRDKEIQALRRDVRKLTAEIAKLRKVLEKSGRSAKN